MGQKIPKCSTCSRQVSILSWSYCVPNVGHSQHLWDTVLIPTSEIIGWEAMHIFNFIRYFKKSKSVFHILAWHLVLSYYLKISISELQLCTLCFLLGCPNKNKLTVAKIKLPSKIKTIKYIYKTPKSYHFSSFSPTK